MNDEQQIIAKVLSGDTEAFRGLVEQHQHAVCGFVRHLLRNASDVEDVSQDVFLAAFVHLKSFDGRRAKFVTWLLTIAHNRCCNRLKKREARPLTTDALPCEALPPEDAAANREVWQRLDQALERLPLEQRTAFVLAEIQEVPYGEIAIIEGVELGTVKSRVSRAKERLRQALKELRPDEAVPRSQSQLRSHS